ncbi:MAG: hypothetical protein ACREYF_27070 [Gammaproteobacteria bacterium]
MELKLLRDVCGADCTLGQIYVDREFECYTVEDVVRPAGEKNRQDLPERRVKSASRFNDSYREEGETSHTSCASVTT